MFDGLRQKIGIETGGVSNAPDYVQKPKEKDMAAPAEVIDIGRGTGETVSQKLEKFLGVLGRNSRATKYPDIDLWALTIICLKAYRPKGLPPLSTWAARYCLIQNGDLPPEAKEVSERHLNRVIYKLCEKIRRRLRPPTKTKKAKLKEVKHLKSMSGN